MIEKPKKNSSRSVTESGLWKMFSKFIRARDANYQGYCRCISCSTVKNWKELDAGHYISAGSDYALKYNEMNVNAQCVACNQHKSGNLIFYRMGLVVKLGEKSVKNLEASHFMKTTRKRLSPFEIEQLHAHYKLKFKELAGQKCLEG